MFIGTDEYGTPITQEDITEMIDCVEREDYSEFEDLSDCVYGQIAPLSKDKGTISFTLPSSTINELDTLAKKQNCTRSDLLRGFVFDGLLRNLNVEYV